MRGVSEPKSDESLAPDEPPTPLWLPVLGAGLFLLALIWAVAG